MKVGAKVEMLWDDNWLKAIGFTPRRNGLGLGIVYCSNGAQIEGDWYLDIGGKLAYDLPIIRTREGVLALLASLGIPAKEFPCPQS
jgi:hypothetical protein